jgi:hypothetical protein
VKFQARIERLIRGNSGDLKPVWGWRVGAADQPWPWIQGQSPAEGLRIDNPSGWRRQALKPRALRSPFAGGQHDWEDLMKVTTSPCDVVEHL